MGQASYPNGVYGLNLSSLLISQGNTELIKRIDSFIDVLENGEREFEGKPIDFLFDPSSNNLIRHSDLAYKFFYDDIKKFLFDNFKILIPDINDSYDPESDTCLFFTIEQICSEADMSGMDSAFDEPQAEELDYLIGIPICAFPNSIVLDSSFTTYADWFLWVVYC